MSLNNRKEYHREYNKKNRVRLCAYKKLWRLKNPDKVNAYKNKFGGEHKRQYNLKNRERINLLVKNRRHRLGISKKYRSDIPFGYKSRGKEYGETWPELRKRIYKRDNWTCQMPGCLKKCHGNGTRDKIQCHHIDYDITNNHDDNLITLCASCHMKTNFNRIDWMNHLARGLKNNVR